MAVNYKSRRCSDCGGRLELNVQKKILHCLYCGREYEREEQYSGNFTINNVVRQTLLDIANRSMESAEKNLSECDKIDSRHIGSVLARLCYHLASAVTGSPSALGHVKRCYELLKKDHAEITDEEEMLYDLFEDASIYATLYLAFDAIGEKERKAIVHKLLLPEKVYAAQTNEPLLRHAALNDDWDMGKAILGNSANVNFRFALDTMTTYFVGRDKLPYFNQLLADERMAAKEWPLIEKYIQTSKDKTTDKAEAVISALSSGVRLKMQVVIENILSPLREEDGELVGRLCTELLRNPLTDNECELLVFFALVNAEPQKSMRILNALKSSEQFILVQPHHFCEFLARDSFSTKK